MMIYSYYVQFTTKISLVFYLLLFLFLAFFSSFFFFLARLLPIFRFHLFTLFSAAAQTRRITYTLIYLVVDDNDDNINVSSKVSFCFESKLNKIIVYLIKNNYCCSECTFDGRFAIQRLKSKKAHFHAVQYLRVAAQMHCPIH